MYTAVSTRAANAYKRVEVETGVGSADPHELINLLFDALLSSLAQARSALLRRDIAVKGREIGRAVSYLETGLKGVLDEEKGGALASRLYSLYDYCILRLTQANIENDANKIEEVSRLIEPLASGWKEIRGQGFKGA